MRIWPRSFFAAVSSATGAGAVDTPFDCGDAGPGMKSETSRTRVGMIGDAYTRYQKRSFAYTALVSITLNVGAVDPSTFTQSTTCHWRGSHGPE